jgi:hypothetical protein
MFQFMVQNGNKGKMDGADFDLFGKLKIALF